MQHAVFSIIFVLSTAVLASPLPQYYSYGSGPGPRGGYDYYNPPRQYTPSGSYYNSPSGSYYSSPGSSVTNGIGQVASGLGQVLGGIAEIPANLAGGVWNGLVGSGPGGHWRGIDAESEGKGGAESGGEGKAAMLEETIKSRDDGSVVEGSGRGGAVEERSLGEEDVALPVMPRVEAPADPADDQGFIEHA